MSAQPFYQTFYQDETLFRLADEPWEVVVQPVETASLPVTISDVPDLLSDLDTLLVESELVVPIPLITVPQEPQPTIQVISPEMTQPVPEPVVLVNALEQVSEQPNTIPDQQKPEVLPPSPPRPKTPSIVPPVQQQARLPKLNHKVLLLADEELDPSNLLFLEKILNAVNLNIDGVDLLNLHGVKDVDFAELVRGKHINHFITFDVPFERLHLDIMMDRYTPVRFEGITFLMADSLPTIEADINLKKRLWGALQRVFLQW